MTRAVVISIGSPSVCTVYEIPRSSTNVQSVVSPAIVITEDRTVDETLFHSMTHCSLVPRFVHVRAPFAAIANEPERVVVREMELGYNVVPLKMGAGTAGLLLRHRGC